MDKPLVTQRSEHKWAMHSGEMMEALGLKAGHHLPAEGMPERLIQGVRVYVLAAKPTAHKSSAHRVMAVCPACERHMSAGRLASQHWKHCPKRAQP